MNVPPFPTKEEEAAYMEGRDNQANAAAFCPYDGRTKLAKAWNLGYADVSDTRGANRPDQYGAQDVLKTVIHADCGHWVPSDWTDKARRYRVAHGSGGYPAGVTVTICNKCAEDIYGDTEDL